MSTRAAIARPAADGGWEGRYHHFDGYPTGLGKALFDLYHGHFNRDVRAMQKFLIDDHPAGWSSIIGTDFTLPPGFNRGNQPKCYCHGDRSEGPFEPLRCKGSDHHGDHCDGSECDPVWIEWAYVLGPEGMAVYGHGHRLLTSVAWSDTPDWEAIRRMDDEED